MVCVVDRFRYNEPNVFAKEEKDLKDSTLISEKPSVKSGFARVTDRLAEELEKLGHEVDVLLSLRDECARETLRILYECLQFRHYSQALYSALKQGKKFVNGYALFGYDDG